MCQGGGGKFEKFLKTDAKAPKMGFYWACRQFLTSSSEIRERKKNFSAPPKSQRDFFLPPLSRVKCSLYYTPSIDNIRLILV